MFIFFLLNHFLDFMPEKKEPLLSVIHPDELIVNEKNATVHEYTKVSNEKEDFIERCNDDDDTKGHAKPETKDPDPDILSENKVNVEIVPDVKSNQVMVQLCSMSLFCCLWSTGK